jgi:hypothetical protein
MANKIKKNDTVTNNIQLVMGRDNLQVVPANTELKVWKVKRDGTIYCSHTYYGTITLKANDVTKVNKPLPVVNVGDVFVSSGGYEQTNIAYYKVMKVTKSSVEVIEIGQTRNYTGPMCGESMPADNSNNDAKPKRVRISVSGNTPCFKAIWGYAYPWNGKPKFFSEWY